MSFRIRNGSRTLILTFVMALMASSCGGNVVAQPGHGDSDSGLDSGLDGNPCEAGEYYHSDKRFGSTEVGDLRCYRTCEAATNCTAVGAPFCSELGLYNGGDYSCNGRIRVCREKATDDCP